MLKYLKFRSKFCKNENKQKHINN